jgi:ribosomal subunit interface protein
MCAVCAIPGRYGAALSLRRDSEEDAMELIVRSRNGKVSAHHRNYIEAKLTKLERYMDEIARATVEIAEEQRHDQGVVHRAQVTLQGKHGVLLRAERHASELTAAVDEIADTLQRQIKRYKEKHWRRGRLRRQGGEYIESVLANGAAQIADEEQPKRIVRTKEFQIKPMYSDEAVEQMELLGHNFFVFRDADTNEINVLYRRQDGNYGLIVASPTG